MRTSRAITGDTIVAIITPPGEGGIAALRLAGPDSLAIASRHLRTPSGDIQPLDHFHLRYCRFCTSTAELVDEVTAVSMPAGHSYTGLEQVEIFCHGGRMVVQLILDELLRSGARAADPGEFTRLAFINGRIDLARAEAVAELIAANSHASYQTAREHLLGAYTEHVASLRDQIVAVTSEVEASIDFPEEEITLAERSEITARLEQVAANLSDLLKTYQGGRIISEGFTVAIGGRPNAGKSSLFNRLLRQERALVHSVAGTTRDYLSEWIELAGFAVNLVDTAGLREKGSKVEREGIERARKIIKESDLLLWLVDLTRRSWQRELDEDMSNLPANKTIVLLNKIDIAKQKTETSTNKLPFIRLSARRGDGLDHLTGQITEQIRRRMPDMTSGLVVTSARHKQKLAVAIKAVKSAIEKNRAEESPEIVAFELRQGSLSLDEITGRVYTEEILGRIFGKFCIGK
ncbi:MAG: tRNA uridine-5-carboxymethylaminomethyl(34) synthesis GTPase MnmE [bacterium]|nr:tRNA uridine-5-carboxymethylaminomethyl(34) synthesis GTPase MnmE [bacterium]